MTERERTDAGTFAETVTVDAVLGVFEAVRGPVITSSDVAEHLDCTTEAARQKLSRLYDQGAVDRRKTGRTVVWWPDDASTSTGRTDEAIHDSSDKDTEVSEWEFVGEGTDDEVRLDDDFADIV